jgi:hypothetical protein
MDGGGEMVNNGEVQKLLAHHVYNIQPSAPASSFQNAPGERPHQDSGYALHVLLRISNMENKFWPFAFNYTLQISNILPHGDCGVPLKRLMGERGDVAKYRMFGCLVIVKLPEKQNGKLEHKFCRGFLLGFTGTLLQIYYWDLESERVKRAFTVKYDECSTITDRPSPNARQLRDALDGKKIPADT